MRNAVTSVAIRKEGGFTKEDVQAAFDAFSDKIDRASARKFKQDLYDAAAVLESRIIQDAPYNPDATKFTHIRDATFISQGPEDRPYVLVGITHSKAPQAYWYEYGTKHQPARPFFRPAQLAVRGQMANIIIGGVTRAILAKS